MQQTYLLLCSVWAVIFWGQTNWRLLVLWPIIPHQLFFSGFNWKFLSEKQWSISISITIFLDELFVKFRRLGSKWNKMMPEAFNRFYNALWYYSAKLLIILGRLISESNGRFGHRERFWSSWFVISLLLMFLTVVCIIYTAFSSYKTQKVFQWVVQVCKRWWPHYE